MDIINHSKFRTIINTPMTEQNGLAYEIECVERILEDCKPEQRDTYETHLQFLKKLALKQDTRQCHLCGSTMDNKYCTNETCAEFK